MRVVIVIPTYNEAENLVRLFDGIQRYAPHADVLIVDDSSPDGTASRVKQIVGSNTRMKNYAVLERNGPRGLGRAYRDGFNRVIDAAYDLIVQMDADLSHSPEYLPAMLDAGTQNDLVIGSRYCRGGGVVNWPWRRRCLSRFANWYVRRITGMPFTDATAGFRCWSLAGLKRVEVESVRSEGYSFQVEMSYRAHVAGLRCSEVPIVFRDRKNGCSKMSRKVIVESIIRPFSLRLNGWYPGGSRSVAVVVGDHCAESGLLTDTAARP